MRSPLLQALLGLALLAAGAGAAWMVVRGRPAPAEQALPGPRPVPVSLVPVPRGELARPVAAVGTLRAGRVAALAPEVGGRVVRVADGLRDGVPLAEGQVIVALDPEPVELELATARTARELAAVRLEGAAATLASAVAARDLAAQQRELLVEDERRWRGLVEDGRAERARLDAATRARLAGDQAVEEAGRVEAAARNAQEGAELDVELADRRVAQLVDRLGRLALRAPFAGRFSAGAGPAGRGRVPELGEVLAPGAPVGEVLALDTVRLMLEVHADDAAALRPGARVTAAPAGRPGLLLEGEVSAVGVAVDPAQRTVRVEALVAAPSAEGSIALADGAFARAELRATPFQDVVHVREDWVTYREGRPVAFVAEPDGDGRLRARLTRLELLRGVHDGRRVVLAGLEEGQVIVARPLDLVGDGALLQPLGAGDGPPAPAAAERGPGPEPGR